MSKDLQSQRPLGKKQPLERSPSANHPETEPSAYGADLRSLERFPPTSSLTRTLRQNAVLRMQQTHGNQAVVRMLVQRQPTNTGTTPHVGIIPVREFIRHVETVEHSYPNSTPQQILTMIRSMYYGSPAGSPGFDRLIPDAPNTGALQMCTDSEGSVCREPVGDCSCVYAHGLAMDTPELQQAVRRLRERADENAIGDNPSPYIQVGSDLIDVGHVLVGMDAILHPRTLDPFRSYGLTSAAAPATWSGDVGAAMVYLREHKQNGRKSSDVVGTPSPTLEDYYHNSAPMTDILGDVDAFSLAGMMGSQTLSAALRQYYVSESGGSPRMTFNRWAHFCDVNHLTFAEAGNRITWTPEARQTVIQNITQFANLFAQRQNPITAMTLVITQQWPEAGQFADRFLQDVQRGLEAELAQNASTAPATP